MVSFHGFCHDVDRCLDGVDPLFHVSLFFLMVLHGIFYDFGICFNEFDKHVFIDVSVAVLIPSCVQFNVYDLLWSFTCFSSFINLSMVFMDLLMTFIVFWNWFKLSLGLDEVVFRDTMRIDETTYIYNIV